MKYRLQFSWLGCYKYHFQPRRFSSPADTKERIFYAQGKLKLFQQIVQAHNISCTIIEKDFSNLYKADLDLRGKLFSDYDYHELRDFLLKYSQPGHILKLFDEFGLISYVLCLSPLPEDIRLHDGAPLQDGYTDNTYLVVGPILKETFTLVDIQKIMFKNKLPDTLYKDLSAFYANIPVPPTLKSLEATLLVISENLFSEKYDLLEPQEFSGITADSSSAFRR